MNMKQQIIIHSTDEIKEYTGAREDVERLAQHLRIETKLPAGLSMISVGQDAPDQQYQDIPWLQLDESNNPLAWKFFNGTQWIEAQPLNALAGMVSGLLVQYGEISFNHIGLNGAWVHSQTLYTPAGTPSEFKFPAPFKAGTIVHAQLTPVFSGIHEGFSSDQYAATDMTTDKIETYLWGLKDFDWCLGAITVTGFSLYTKTMEKIISPGKDIKFRWTAIGEKL